MIAVPARRRPRFRPRPRDLPQLLYDLAFGSLLRGLRDEARDILRRDAAFPALDIACGTGLQVRALGPDARRAIGIDASAAAVSYASRRAPGASFVRGDARRLPVKDGAVRAAVLSFALHEQAPEDRAAMLAEASRVLAPGGILVATDFERPWDRASRRGRRLAATVDLAGGLRHSRLARDFLRRGGLRALLRETGWVETGRRNHPSGSIAVVAAKRRGDESGPRGR